MAVDFSKRQYLKTESENSVRVTEFNEGEVIFRKDADGSCMYEVLTGSVGIYLNYGTDKQVLLAEKKAGSFFGEIALLENRPRTAWAVAMGDMTKLREISANGFIVYIRQNPDNLKIIMDAMSDRFKEQRKEYFDVCDTVAQYHQAVENFELLSDDLMKKVERYSLEAEKHHKREESIKAFKEQNK